MAGPAKTLNRSAKTRSADAAADLATNPLLFAKADLVEALKTWLNYLAQERRASGHTISAYQTDVGDFLKFLSFYDGDAPNVARLGALTRSDIRAWLSQRNGRGLVAASNARALSAIKSLARRLVRDGKIELVAGLKHVVSPNVMVLMDGIIMDEVDEVVFCTGYVPNFLNTSAIKLNAIDKDDTCTMTELYHGVFHPDYADSVVCLHYAIVPGNAVTVRGLISMAVAKVWAGRSILPPQTEMEVDVVRY